MMNDDIHLSIIIHRGSPLDYQIYRHTSLWMQATSGKPMIAEILGSTGFFEFQTSFNENPTQHPDFVDKVNVGPLSSSAGASNLEDLVGVLREIEIRNEDREFNCQTWVERCLSHLRDLGRLTAAQCNNAVDAMVDAISEAEDQEP